jgi:bifunctional DNA-binding transcriptional regulator/antitoxin component of YhaV-PrlF toxin-antitoxin module
MPIQFERSVLESSNQLRVNIPQEIAKALTIKKGTVLLISLTDHGIIMKKAKTQ